MGAGWLITFLVFARIGLTGVAEAQQTEGVWDNAFRYASDSADVAKGTSVFFLTKPDIIVQVSKHEYGADTFEITAVTPRYPAELLRTQVEKMCAIIGVPARGLQVGTAQLSPDPRLNSTRATFATNGVIDRQKGILRVGPIIQAFAGAPAANTVHAISILFNGEQPTPNELRSYRTPGLRLQAVAMESPRVIEYRVQLLSQDPKLLEVPDGTSTPEQKPAVTASTVQRTGVDWLMWGALIAAAAAASTLAYFLMMRATAKSHR